MSLQHNPKHPKIHKKKLSQEQVRLLEATFDASKKLEPERKFELARELGVPPRQIAIWYQNKRVRWRNQNLELDYGEIRVKLESAVADKEKLEEQVRNLKAELKVAHDMLVNLSSSSQAQQGREYHAFSGHVPPVSSLSSCCDESSLNDDVGFSGNNNNINSDSNNNWCYGGDVRASLQYEEFYASLLVGSKQGQDFGEVTDERYLNWPQKW